MDRIRARAALCVLVGMLAGALGLPVGVSAGSTTVAVSSGGFQPGTITVKQGDTVVWVNTDSVAHAVMPRAGGFRGSGEIAPGGAFKAKMTKPGRWTYEDPLNFLGSGGMIVVEPGPTPKPTAKPTPRPTPKPTPKPTTTVKATPGPTATPASPTDAPTAEASPSPTDVLTGAAGGAGGSGGSGDSSGQGGSSGGDKTAAGLPGNHDASDGFFGMLGVLLLAGLVGLLLAGWTYMGRTRTGATLVTAGASLGAPAQPTSGGRIDAPATATVGHVAAPGASPRPAPWIERNRGANPYTAGVTARSAGFTGDAATIPPGAGATVAAVGGERGLWTEEWDPVRPIAPEPAPDHDDSDLWEI